MSNYAIMLENSLEKKMCAEVLLHESRSRFSNKTGDVDDECKKLKLSSWNVTAKKNLN